MTWRWCSRLVETRFAGRAGRVTVELRRHAATCGRCRELLLVTETLQEPVAGAPSAVDPALIWARARVERRLRRQASASRVRTALHVALGAVIAGAAGALIAVSDPVVWPDLVELGSWRESSQAIVEPIGSSQGDLGVWLYSLPALVVLAFASLWRWVSRDA